MTGRPVSSTAPDEGRDAGPRARLLADQRVMFLLVGAFNTAFGIVIFTTLQLTLGRVLHYLGVLLAAHVITVLVAFVLHRRFVFRVAGTGSVLVDLVRFQSVYLSSLALNILVLPLLVEVAGLEVIPAQVGFGVTMAALSWFAHKHFSFRRPAGRT